MKMMKISAKSASIDLIIAIVINGEQDLTWLRNRVRSFYANWVDDAAKQADFTFREILFNWGITLPRLLSL